MQAIFDAAKRTDRMLSDQEVLEIVRASRGAVSRTACRPSAAVPPRLEVAPPLLELGLEPGLALLGEPAGADLEVLGEVHQQHEPDGEPHEPALLEAPARRRAGPRRPSRGRAR